MQYKAMDKCGKVIAGRVQAANVDDLEQRLSCMGLDLISHRETRSPGIFASPGRVSRRELIGFCFELEQLLSGGVPIFEALTDLRDATGDRKLREVVASMVESVKGGRTLSDAMAAHPGVFDEVLVNLVRTGELSGQIGAVLASITKNLKWQDELAAQMRNLVLYPLFVGCLVLGVLVFLMTFLVPQLVSLLQTVHQELPLQTRLLIQASNFFIGFWYLVIAFPAIAFILVRVLIRSSPVTRLLVDELKLKVWLIGPISKKIMLARFANYFALMHASGIAVLECVRISESLIGNKVIEAATRQAGQQIADGASISAGFENSGLFPSLVVRMMRVGETTGALDTALRNISYFYERDVHESMGRVQTLMGPLMTVALGGLMFWVVMSVLGPIYDLISQIEL